MQARSYRIRSQALVGQLCRESSIQKDLEGEAILIYALVLC